MTETTKNYGTEFIEALDKVAGRCLLTYAQRKEYRAHDRDGVAKKMRSHGYEFVKAAKEGTAEELAAVIKQRIDALNAAASTSTLLAANSITLMSLL